MKKTKEVEKLQFVERMRYKKHIRIINKAGGFITRLSAFFYASRGYFKGHPKDIQYIGSNGESAHLGLLLHEFICYIQSKIHPCITVLSF